MGRKINLVGEKFGRLTVLEELPNRVSPRGWSKTQWKCRCECGNIASVTTQDLRKGDIKSCGCLKNDETILRMTTHGDTNTRLYKIWVAMRRRCNNINNSDYSNYGGRGIRVCVEWNEEYLSFKEWALSHGYSDDLTIDRIDVNGNYDPNNCRWISMKDQCNNRRSNRIYTYHGSEYNIRQLSDMFNIPYSRLYMRLYSGWSIDKALNTR